MRIKKTINVLVVDDSLLFREVISRGISTDPDIEVIAKAADPFEARDKLLQYQPDIMICDIEMPKMNGIEFINRLLPQYPIPVIVVSVISHAVFDALNAGAVDFIAKPNMREANNVEVFIEELIEKIKIASMAKVLPRRNTVKQSPDPVHSTGITKKLIAIGASTGGTEAILNLLKSLSSNLPGIVIVQHIPPLFSTMFAERLNSELPLSVKEAQTGDYIETGTVLIAPGDRHMRVKKEGAKYKVECFRGEKVNGHCPSIDILFDSVAKEVGKQAIGIILTGMGYDGAKGLLAMRRKGARTIGQDEKTSVVYGMPKVAFEIGAVEKQASLSAIPNVLYSMI
jgi:two-component system chemotaxis response regulator CheB